MQRRVNGIKTLISKNQYKIKYICVTVNDVIPENNVIRLKMWELSWFFSESQQ